MQKEGDTVRSVVQTGSSAFCLGRPVTVSAEVSREPRVQEGEAGQVDDQEAGQRPSGQVTVWTTAWWGGLSVCSGCGTWFPVLLVDERWEETQGPDLGHQPQQRMTEVAG